MNTRKLSSSAVLATMTVVVFVGALKIGANSQRPKGIGPAKAELRHLPNAIVFDSTDAPVRLRDLFVWRTDTVLIVVVTSNCVGCRGQLIKATELREQLGMRMVAIAMSPSKSLLLEGLKGIQIDFPVFRTNPNFASEAHVENVPHFIVANGLKIIRQGNADSILVDLTRMAEKR
jgi:hypothetical protein